MANPSALLVLSLSAVLLVACTSVSVGATETLPWGVDRIGARCVWDNDMNMIVDDPARAAGVPIAFIDEGIYYEEIDNQPCYHPDLHVNVRGGVTFKHNVGCTVTQHTYHNDTWRGHGTHVAGTIAAANNGEGVIGTAPNTGIYAVKIEASIEIGLAKAIAAAINWAVGRGIRVISTSLALATDEPVLRTACDNAYNRPDGALLIAAAGNINSCVEYPANYSSVIAVGAVDQYDQRWVASPDWGSNFGPELEFVAPGVDINSTMPGGGYGNKTGTSFAAPHVAAVAALIFASKPDPDYDLNGDGWNNTEVRQKLRQLALDLGPRGRDDEYGYGLINAWATLQRPLGDINIDYIVDYRDLNIASRAFGSIPDHPNWNQTADINIDRIVDYRDINIISRNYGKQDP
jgi:subtilisin